MGPSPIATRRRQTVGKPDPRDPDNKSHGGNKDEGQCRTCGGSGRNPSNRSLDCSTCGGSGKR